MTLTLACRMCGEEFTVKRKRGLPRSFCDGCRVKRAKQRKGRRRYASERI